MINNIDIENLLNNTAIVINSIEEKLELYRILDGDGWKWSGSRRDNLLNINADPIISVASRSYGEIAISTSKLWHGISWGWLNYYQKRGYRIINIQQFKEETGITHKEETPIKEVFKNPIDNNLSRIEV